jgi:hypothetical protein
MSEPRLRLRFSLIDGPELRCLHCDTWWPIVPECWRADRNEWHMCLACQREKARLYAALRMRDKEYRVAKADKSRRYRAWLKEACPQYLQAYDREKRARNRAKAVEYRIARKEAAA